MKSMWSFEHRDPQTGELFQIHSACPAMKQQAYSIHLLYSKPILNEGPSKCFFISLSKMFLVIWNFTITYSNATPNFFLQHCERIQQGLNEQEIDYSWKGNDHKYLKVANFVLGMPTF